MEHRWGLRMQMDVPVRVWTPDHIAAQARLTDISISGALVHSSLPVPLWSRVNLHLRPFGGSKTRRLRIEGQVVRITPDGFGIEWTDFAPSAARELIRYHRAQTLERRVNTPITGTELRATNRD